MNLYGTTTGHFETTYSMWVPDEDYNKFIEENPGYDIDNDPDEIWEHFKKLGCYDEIEDSCDYDVVLRVVKVEK